MLSESESVPVAELQQACGLGASALSQHLRVLKDAALVADERRGRRVIYRLSPEPLLEIVDWMLKFAAVWEKRLDALGGFLERGPYKPEMQPRASADAPGEEET